KAVTALPEILVAPDVTSGRRAPARHVQPAPEPAARHAPVTVPASAGLTRRDWRTALVFWLVSAAVAAVYVVLATPGSLDEEPRVGAHLALGHGFLSPLDPSPSAEPTAWVPPLYPLLCAGVYRVLGVETAAAVRALLLINAACLG